MSRYIDAEWLLNFFEPYPDNYQTPLGSLRACADDAPSIDIVRCKECKWCFYVESDDVYACIKKGIEHKLYNPEKHFCSYGEREGE